MSKKICMLLHEFYPNDIRVSKEASALIEAGIEVHLICLQRKGEASKELVNGIQVHRIELAQTFFWRGIWDILLVLLGFFQPIFYKKLYWLNSREKFDAIHVHDLPLAGTALKLKKQQPETKVVLDFHENYPEALKVWFAWKANPLIRLKNNIFFGYKKWLKYEKKACEECDQIIVVVDEMKERVHHVHQIPYEKITVITNSETVDFLNQELFPEVYTKEDGDFILAYTGNVGPHRGVDTVVNGMAYLKDYPQIKLEITGKLSTDTEKWLRNIIEENGIGNQVKINGYQPFNKFFSYMALADVNLIPHNRNGHTDNTIPHKLYQGMMVGKPVIVSDAPPLKRVVEELQSGLVFEANNAKDFAKKTLTLFQNSDLAKTLGTNGNLRTTKEGFNWENEGLKLSKMYFSI